jgi:hypothetical protein
MSGNLIGGTVPRTQLILNQTAREWSINLYLNKAFASSTQDRYFVYNLMVPKTIGCGFNTRKGISNNNTITSYTANTSDIILDDGITYREAKSSEISATIDILPTTNEIGCFYIFQANILIKAGTNACNVYLCFTNTLFIDCGEKTYGCNKFPLYLNYKEEIAVYWYQLGTDIYGEAARDESGRSVSLSSDGTIIAIGAPRNDDNGDQSGHVRIYEYDGKSWNQLGNDIDGEAEIDYSGISVSLSSDGKIVAIGAERNDGTEKGENDGHVRIYQYDGTSWNQLGEDESDYSGYSISLSEDGKTVAIGAIGNDGRGYRTGHVRIYEYDGTKWNQLGSDIDGEAENDESGYSVSLSADGRIVAVSSIENKETRGHVRVYEYTNSQWTQLGTDIEGESIYDYSGYSVSLSSDGKIIAISATDNDGVNG